MPDNLNSESYMLLARWTHVCIRMVLSRGGKLATERDYRKSVLFVSTALHFFFTNWSGFT